VKTSEVKVGGHYLARVNGNLVTVRLDAVREVFRGSRGRAYAYDVTNLKTNRRTTFRSAAKFRSEVKPEPLGVGGLKGIKVDEVDLTPTPNEDKRYEMMSAFEAQKMNKQDATEGTRRPFSEDSASDRSEDSSNEEEQEDEKSPDPTSTDTCSTFLPEDGQKSNSKLILLEADFQPEGKRRSDPTRRLSTLSDPAPVREAEEEPNSAAVEQLAAATSTPSTETNRPFALPSPISATGTPASASVGLAAQLAVSNHFQASSTAAKVAGYTPTDEQRAILDIAPTLRHGQQFVIAAGAGTGKTSTLKMLEEVLPGRGQYTAFNASLVADAKTKFKKCRCQPDGTLVTVPVAYTDGTYGRKEVPIESLRFGDKVTSWGGESGYQIIRKRGAHIRQPTRRQYNGDLVVVTASGRRSRYTPEHPCITLVGPAFEHKHIVYLMRRGNHYKIGLCSWNISEKQRNGFRSRIDGEGADAAWVLQAFDDRDEAALTEALMQYTYNIPGWTFEYDGRRQPSRGGNRVRRIVVGLHRLWDRIPSNRQQAEKCLRTLGMDIDLPLWERTSPIPFESSAAVVHACNLRSGMRVLVLDNCLFKTTSGSPMHTSPKKVWESIEVSRETYSGQVTSLYVNNDHTYFADGVLTHNCNTTHSLAFGAVGRLYASRLNGPRVRSEQIAQILGIQPFPVDVTVEGENKTKNLSPSFLAGQVVVAVRKFCQSADRQLERKCFRYIDGIDYSTDKKRSYENNDAVKDYLLSFARKAWDDLSQPAGRLPFNHDVYVKVFQLGEGKDSPYISADYILLDEAHDTAEVLLDILQRQRHALLIYVGDSCQQIYEWRGAIDAMKAFPSAPRRLLSQSFRFGQIIADVANSVLATLDEPTDLIMKGKPGMPSRVDKVGDPRAILCRTNARAVANVLQRIQEGKHPHLIGGGSEVVAFVKAAKQLQAHQPCSHQELCCFSNWKEVEAYSKLDEGEDLRLMVRLIKEFGCDPIISALEHMPDEKDADLIVCTAHKSKGREWQTVKLAEDFPPSTRMTDADRRLLYVALTRAQQTLDISVCPPFHGGQDEESGVEYEGLQINYTVPVSYTHLTLPTICSV